MMYIFFLFDYMVGLSCQLEINVNIMLKINKTVQDGCVKSTRGDMIPLQEIRFHYRKYDSNRGEEEEGPMGKIYPMLPSVDPRTQPKFASNYPINSLFTIKPIHWMHARGWCEKSLHVVIEACGLLKL